MIAACILGVAGPVLTAEEQALFAQARPWGFILFRRNIESREQVRRLTDDLRRAVGRDDAPVLIDQEGGRVQRMGPPHWSRYPPASAFRTATNDPLAARDLARLGARLMAHDLAEVGITVDCAPVLDVPVPGAHDIIGDRAYGLDPAEVGLMGRAVAEGLLAGGVLPVIKHVPGHGRALADSHHHLPVVEAGEDQLAAWDFLPFRMLSDMPMAMTAHVVFRALDPRRPATLSRRVISMIREDLGFDGLLMTDDLSMKALAGPMQARAAGALRAGCDVVLHCNGDLGEMQAVLAGTRPLRGRALRRAEAALARRVALAEPLQVEEARARFDIALTGRLKAAAGPDVGEAAVP